MLSHPHPTKIGWLLPFYARAGSSPETPPAAPSGSYGDAEVPTGTINGVNDTFTVANAPSPAGSLRLFKNGMLMTAGGEDYTLTGTSIVFVAAAIPQTGDSLIAHYRY